jgi:putative nucleotidyltransferase with HDIG domain
MSSKAKQILQRTDVDKLPSLPHVLLQLLDTCQSETIDYARLSEILRYDPCLAMRIQAICYRNHCHHTHQTSSPHLDTGSFSELPITEDRLAELGINTIKSIAVTATVQQFFSRTSLERTAFLKQHWQHSVTCALVSRSLAKLCNYPDPEEAYFAGLLHDIGQLVLENAFPQKYTGTFAELSEDKNFHNLEQQEFDTSHQQVGAALLQRHGASSFIQDAIRFHHEKAEELMDAHLLVRIIHIANQLSSSYFREQDQDVFDAARVLLQQEKPILLELLEKALSQLDGITAELEISLDTDGLDGESAKQKEASDEFKQVRLAEQVRNIALLDGLHQHLSRCDNQQQLLGTITEHISILFAVNDCILFLYDPVDDRIKAVATDQLPRQLNDISIPLIAGRSLITDSLLDKQAMHSFSEQADGPEKHLSVVDQQITGITGKDGIICLPMIMNNAAIGCLVLGVDSRQQESLWKQLPLLMRLINEVAHTLSSHHEDKGLPAARTGEIEQLRMRIREVLHEVRNPLSIVNNYLGLLGYKLEKDKPAQEDVETIKAEIERINHILSRLTSTEETGGETAPVDLNAIIADLTHVFQTSLFASKNIQVSLDLDERIESINSNANALKQIYTNLIKNGVEALPANGQLMVYTQDYVNVDGKEHIEICVADDGPGIDIEILPKLFSPVESTKGEGHAGLGLTIVKNLVNELDGSISCRSSDKGTSFHILLPK